MSSPAPSFYAIIPAHVRYCKDIEPGAKLLYGEITALTQTHGYCWASNKYFAELYDVDERTIQLWLRSLKSQKFIVVEYDKSNFYSPRKIWIYQEVKNMFTKRNNLHDHAKKSSAAPEENFTHNITLNNTEEKRERDGEQAPQTPSVSLPRFTLNQITMAQEDYDKLCEQFGAEVVKAKIEEFDDFSRSKPREFKKYACHASTIRSWIRRDMKGNEVKSIKPADTNRSWLEKLKAKFSQRSDMHFSPEGLVIYAGNAQKIFNIKDHGFKEQVLAYLRLMKLPIEGL